MGAKDVLNLPWKKVTDFGDLSTTHEDRRGYLYVCETDVDTFIENIYRDISRKLNISYENLCPILKAENNAFYKLKEHLFSKYDGYARKSTRILELLDTLRVPDISNVEISVAANHVSICLKMFESLTDMEKTLFLQKIGKIDIKVEHFPTQTATVE